MPNTDDTTPTTTSPESIEPEVLPAAVDDAVLDRVTEQINSYVHTSSLDLAMNVGKVIIEELYGGDEAAWRDRGEKDSSFRKLRDRAQKDDEGNRQLHLSPAVLSRSTAIYAMSKRLGVSDWKHMGVSHLRAIAALPSDKQASVVKMAMDREWDVARVEKKCKDLRAKQAKKDAEEGKVSRGRPTLPAYVKGFGKLKKVIAETIADEVPEDIFESLTPEKAEKLIDQSKALLEDVEEQLKALKKLRMQVKERIAAYEGPEGGEE